MNVETSIKWFYDRLGKTFYSMTQRNGQWVNSKQGYDCSSAVYYALIAGGFLPPTTWIGNTDSLFGDLERAGWVRTNTPKRGDVFIWGIRGASGGASGHTGMFVNNSDIIHCAYGYNGIHVDNHNWLRSINGNPAVTFYTPNGKPYEGDDDQDVAPGSTIKFNKTFTVNDVQLIGGTWQVRSNELCLIDFSWDDNGIPAEPLYEVDADGYQTTDQDLTIGSKFILPGKYTVLDVGEYKGRWLALIQWNIYKFWVDLEPATEIKASGDGTPIPPLAPKSPKPEPKPEPDPTPIDPAPPQGNQPETPLEPPIVTPQPPKYEPKENDMAFTKEQQKEIAIATTKAFEQLEAATNNEITIGISSRTKATIYFTGDSLILLGGLVLFAPTAFGLPISFEQITALSGMLIAAGTGLLVMFGIYKKGK